MVECAAKGSGTPCEGPPSRRCGLCGAVAYCSISHLLSHWNNHKEECGRFERQMRHADILDDFPFTFSREINHVDSRCAFLVSSGLHESRLWKSECTCQSISSDDTCINDDWSLPSFSCPCIGPRTLLSMCLESWTDYYRWRCLPFQSPVALLLHWSLTIYHCFQLSCCKASDITGKLIIHYLGPDKELLQLSTFRELGALFPGVDLCIEFFGPAVPGSRDGKEIRLDNYPHCTEKECSCRTSEINGNMELSVGKTSAMTLKFHKGLYHECSRNGMKASLPHIIIAPNAGIAAYPSWLPTIELIKEIGVPAMFTDFCEEAATLAAKCIEAVTGTPLRIPVQINPFRQPILVEDNALYLPCYSNCFLFGI